MTNLTPGEPPKKWDDLTEKEKARYIEGLLELWEEQRQDADPGSLYGEEFELEQLICAHRCAAAMLELRLWRSSRD